jgi:hypothetical protein
MIFVAYQSYDDYDAALAQQGQPPPSSSAPSASNAPVGKGDSKRVWETVEEDPIDVYWREKDGKVARSRDSKFCKHGPNAMCDYCMPLEVRQSRCEPCKSDLSFVSHTMPSFTRRRTLNIYHSTPIFGKYNRLAPPNLRTFHLSHPKYTSSRTRVRRADTLLGQAVSAVAANLQQSHCSHSPSVWSTISSLPHMTWSTGSSKPGVLLEINALAS